MQIKFRSLSISHKNAPVKIREILSLDEQAIHSIFTKAEGFFQFGWCPNPLHLQSKQKFITAMN